MSYPNWVLGHQQEPFHSASLAVIAGIKGIAIQERVRPAVQVVPGRRRQNQSVAFNALRLSFRSEVPVLGLSANSQSTAFGVRAKTASGMEYFQVVLVVVIKQAEDKASSSDRNSHGFGNRRAHCR
jgi:hypothetical protein